MACVCTIFCGFEADVRDACCVCSRRPQVVRGARGPRRAGATALFVVAAGRAASVASGAIGVWVG
eukprot:402861-Lingulodinium_polyedra.AAC.1